MWLSCRGALRVMLAACWAWGPLEEGWQLHPCVQNGHHRSGCWLLLPCSCLGAAHEGIHAPAVLTSGSHLPAPSQGRAMEGDPCRAQLGCAALLSCPLHPLFTPCRL